MSVDAYGELKQTAEMERRTRLNVRCAQCAKLLAQMVTSPWRIRCARCKADNQSAD
jgi:hypothetical protein